MPTNDEAIRIELERPVSTPTQRVSSARPSHPDDVVNGVSSDVAEPPPLQQVPSEPIPVQQDDLQDVVGGGQLNDTDESILDGTPGVNTSINANRDAQMIPRRLHLRRGHEINPRPRPRS